MPPKTKTPEVKPEIKTGVPGGWTESPLQLSMTGRMELRQAVETKRIKLSVNDPNGYGRLLDSWNRQQTLLFGDKWKERMIDWRLSSGTSK